MLAGFFKFAVVAAVVAFVVANLLSHRTIVLAPSNTRSRAAASAYASSGETRPASGEHGYGRVELLPDRLGQYHADVEIDGRRLPMLVDTGASFVALTYDDAASVGFRPMPSDFKIKIMTANGISFAAGVRLREVRLDTIDVGDVPAIVMPQGASVTSLLGMSFLKKLGSFQIAEGNLVLKP